MEREIYIVEEILKRKVTKQGPKYLIKWKGYPRDQSTWEPEENLLYLQDDKHKQQFDSFINKKRKPKKQPASKKGKALLRQSLDSRTEVTPSKDLTSESGRKPTETDSSKKAKELQQKSEPSGRIKILAEYIDEDGTSQFVFQQMSRTREMTDLQLKALFPSQLCLFYEDKIKRRLLSKS